MSDATKLDSKPSTTIPLKHTSGLTEEEKNVIKTLEEMMNLKIFQKMILNGQVIVPIN